MGESIRNQIIELTLSIFSTSEVIVYNIVRRKDSK